MTAQLNKYLLADLAITCFTPHGFEQQQNICYSFINYIPKDHELEHAAIREKSPVNKDK